MPLSYKLDEFTEGGFLAPGSYRWTNCRFSDYQYPNGGQQTFAFIVDLESITEGTIKEQIWSVGALTNFEAGPGRGKLPDDINGGMSIESTGNTTALSKSSNFFLLMQSLTKAGYPEARKSGYADLDFEGMVAFMDLYDQEKRDIRGEGEQAAAPKLDSQGRPFRNQIVLVRAIDTLPWDAAEKKGPVKSRPATGSSTTGSTATRSPARRTPTPAPVEPEATGDQGEGEGDDGGEFPPTNGTSDLDVLNGMTPEEALVDLLIQSTATGAGITVAAARSLAFRTFRDASGGARGDITGFLTNKEWLANLQDNYGLLWEAGGAGGTIKAG